MVLLRDVFCGSCLVYLPQGRGGGERGEKSRAYCYAIKRGERASIAKIAAHIGRQRKEDGIHEVLGEDAALVPMPKSAPLPKGALWPARMLAEALVTERLGAYVLPVLERAVAVQRSSAAAPGMRPRAADHLKSFRILPITISPSRIVIVDDVITAGATMLAAISAVFDAIPDSTPQRFAFFRTQSEGELESIWSPVRSRISLQQYGGTRRNP